MVFNQSLARNDGSHSKLFGTCSYPAKRNSSMVVGLGAVAEITSRGSRTKFRRFVFVRHQVEKLAMTAIEFPPMQKGASFGLDA
jgi:hypothetical protein